MRLTTIILLFVCLTCSAQNWKRGLAVSGYHILTVAVGAIGDAQYDMGNKDLAHFMKAAEVGMLIGGPFLFKIKMPDAIPYVSSYVFMRFATFDSFYNATRDLPLLYNGTTSAYDRVMRKMPDHGKVWYKSISLVLGFAIPINEL